MAGSTIETFNGIAFLAVPVVAAVWANRGGNWKWTLTATAIADAVYMVMSDIIVNASPAWDRSMVGWTVDALLAAIYGLAVAGMVIGVSKLVRTLKTKMV